jgi:cysteine dioxygenase
MGLTPEKFFEILDRYNERVPLDHLVAHMDKLDIGLEDVGDVVHFDDSRYQRNLYCQGSAYQALILCWKPDQRSPIHDHRGSSCGVKVLQGVATETIFERNGRGHLKFKEVSDLVSGCVVGSQDDDIHEVANLDNENLVTLHVYSPPLKQMGMYEIGRNERWEYFDPVNENVSGLGI